MEYEPDPDLRDVEQIPLTEKGGVEAFLTREVLPWAPDAWYVADSVKVGYEINFNRHFYRPPPLRTLEEIRADILALERETEGLLEGMVATETLSTATKLRVYADTSVFGGCEDDEFRCPSRRLFDQFVRGDMTLLLSAVTLNELERAPERVRAVLHSVPEENTEFLDLSPEVEELANHYISDGAIASKMLPDALHIALATSARADVLVSWNFRHMVNLKRVRAYNSVNLKNGYQRLDIRMPREVLDDAQVRSQEL